MAQSTTTQDQVEPESERPKESSSGLAAQVARDSLSPPDWLSLDDHEELLWGGSPSFKTFLPNLGLSIVIAGIGMILASIGALQLLGELPSTIRLGVVVIGGIMVVIAIGFLVVNYRSYRRRHYAITTKAIYRRWDGSTTQIEMRNTCRILCEQSWLDRQFSCGDLKIGWSKDGKEKIIYPAIPRPNQAQKRLFEVAERQQKKP